MGSPGIFGISTPEEFLHSVEKVYQRYLQSKYSEDLLYVLMGLNHLREWIAPGYRAGGKPTNAAEIFSEAIYGDADNDIVRLLCNRTKHLRKMETSTEFGVTMAEWSNLASVHSLAEGATLGHLVEDKDIIEVCDSVIDYYKKNWFGQNED